MARDLSITTPLLSPLQAYRFLKWTNKKMEKSIFTVPLCSTVFLEWQIRSHKEVGGVTDKCDDYVEEKNGVGFFFNVFCFSTLFTSGDKASKGVCTDADDVMWSPGACIPGAQMALLQKTDEGSVSYQQIPGSLLRGSVCKWRSGIWVCLVELCGANLGFLSGSSGPVQLSPSLHPASETQCTV